MWHCFKDHLNSVPSDRENLVKVRNQFSFFLRFSKGRELADKVRKGWEMDQKTQFIKTINMMFDYRQNQIVRKLYPLVSNILKYSLSKKISCKTGI